MDKNAKIFVAGRGTLIGAALLRELRRQGCANVIDPRAEPDLTDAAAVEAFFERYAPAFVFLAGGKSGGIRTNQKYPADLMLNNLLLECHVISSSHRHGAKKLLFLASSCTYPKHCPQPMQVESLLAGPLEPTSEAYSVAKLAGVKLCQAYRQQHGANFISGVLADVFGIEDKFSLEDSHVVPALIIKMHDAKERGLEHVDIWGTGNARRELSFADDLANACLLVMRDYNEAEPINIGVGVDVSIRELAEQIKDVVGYSGELRFDASKPDGAPVKLLDSTRLRVMGWRARTPLKSALAATYERFVQITQCKESASTMP